MQRIEELKGVVNSGFSVIDIQLFAVPRLVNSVFLPPSY